MEISSALLMLVTLTATNIVWSANLTARADGGENLRSRVSSRADTGIHAHVKLNFSFCHVQNSPPALVHYGNVTISIRPAKSCKHNGVHSHPMNLRLELDN